MVDLSNPFSVLEHCSVIEPTSFFSYSKNLIEALNTTGVYGSTDYITGRSLWNYLVNISSTALPWCVIGNFNAILLATEKLSTCPPSISVKEFNDMVLATGLKDLGYNGNSFTWANNRNG